MSSFIEFVWKEWRSVIAQGLPDLKTEFERHLFLLVKLVDVKSELWNEFFTMVRKRENIYD